MKRIVYLIAAASLSIFSVNQAYAQTKADPAKRAEMRVKKLDEPLNLNSRQETELKGLFEKQITNQKAKKAEEMEAHKQNRQAFNSELKRILSEDQYKKLQEKRAEKRKSGNPEQSIEQKLNLYKRELNLTDKQSADVKTALEKHAAKVSSIKSERKSVNEDITREKMKIARQSLQKDLKNILNKEQLAKLRELRKSHKNKRKQLKK